MEARSYPLTGMNPVDRELFAPVDPVAKANKRSFLTSAGLFILLLCSFSGNVYQYRLQQSQPVRVLSMNNAGQVESFSFRLNSFSLHKTEALASLRTAITTWIEDFGSRIRNPLNGEIATRAFPQSMLFLSSDLAKAYTQQETLNHEVSQFMSSVEPEFRIVVTNINLRNLDRKPYEADIYYDKVYYSQPLTIAGRKSFLRTIRFTVNPADDEVQRLKQRSGTDIETLLKVNPLILAVTQAGDEQAFAANLQ